MIFVCHSSNRLMAYITTSERKKYYTHQGKFLSSRMKPLMDFNKVTSVNMSVNLRRGYIGMAEQFLYYAKICTAFKKVCCKGMPECMRGNQFFNLCCVCIFLIDIPYC